MERIGVRELRNYTSRVVRRAQAGEVILVTVDGVPAAQLGPITAPPGGASLSRLVAAGRVARPQTDAPARTPEPIASTHARTTTEIIRDQRDR